MDRRVRPAAAGHVVAGIACAMEEAIVARVVGRAGRTRLHLRIGLELAGFFHSRWLLFVVAPCVSHKNEIVDEVWLLLHRQTVFQKRKWPIMRLFVGSETDASSSLRFTRPRRVRMYPTPAAQTTSRPPMARDSPVSMEVKDGVAVISMSNPPVNALAVPGAQTLRFSRRFALLFG